MTIINTYLSASQPQNELEIAYKEENNKKIKPTCLALSENCLKCGSRVGSKNPQALEATTTTNPVISTPGQ